jgi:hypothetical protein
MKRQRTIAGATCLGLGGAAWGFGLFRLLVDPGAQQIGEQLRFLREWMLLFSDTLGGLGAGVLGAASCACGTVLLVKGFGLIRAGARSLTPPVAPRSDRAGRHGVPGGPPTEVPW